MRRFWRQTSVAAQGPIYIITLDEKPLKLPGGGHLQIPARSLAEAVAEEWAQAPENFTADDLPLTRLTSTAQDRVSQHREDIIGQLAAYGMNDLLCYRAETPAPLVALQAQNWDKWLNWAESRHKIQLLVTHGVQPITQSPAAHARFTEILGTLSNDSLAALGVIVPALGSLVLSLAMAQGALTAQEACDTALLDELWQEAQWGGDADAAARRQHIVNDVTVSTRFMVLCTP